MILLKVNFKHSVLFIIGKLFLVETNWKEKDSKLVIATSLNLDDINESDRSDLIDEFEYFQADQQTLTDSTFDIEFIEKKFGRDAPDFVIKLNSKLNS